MSNLSVMENFITDLNMLYKEELSCREFRKKYDSPNVELPMPLYHLWHYIDDEDIRLKDSEYREMQKNELKKMILLIEKGAPLEEIEKIHFLGSTD